MTLGEHDFLSTTTAKIIDHQIFTYFGLPPCKWCSNGFEQDPRYHEDTAS